MKIDRRAFFRVAAVGSVPLLAATATAQEPKSCPSADAALAAQLGLADPAVQFAEIDQLGAVGTAPARHEEVRAAFGLLWKSPRTSNHMTIARYFEAITLLNPTEKNFTGAVAKYNEEWSVRANPLITSFFALTSTLPARGDQTSWCAAFVSFALNAADKKSGLSAMSGAYRTYSNSTDTPQVGDVVVFAKTGEDGKAGFGHVGFYISETASHVRLLGGNQRGVSGSSGAVCEADYPKIAADMRLHSFRKVV